MIGFQWRSVLLLSILAVVAETTAQIRHPMLERIFNRHAFAGLVSGVPAVYASAKLDYDLEGDAGVVHFSNCQQVENTNSESIIESQYALFRLLAVNCLALKRHSQGLPATRSHFPSQLSESLVAAFPATATVNIGGQDVESLTGASLRDNRKGWRASRVAHGGMKIATDDDERTYIIMSRADFDRDGNEDLLIRIDWAARGGSGRAFNLIQLSKTSTNGPIRVSWRAP